MRTYIYNELNTKSIKGNMTNYNKKNLTIGQKQVNLKQKYDIYMYNY